MNIINEEERMGRLKLTELKYKQPELFVIRRKKKKKKRSTKTDCNNLIGMESLTTVSTEVEVSSIDVRLHPLTGSLTMESRNQLMEGTVDSNKKVIPADQYDNNKNILSDDECDEFHDAEEDHLLGFVPPSVETTLELVKEEEQIDRNNNDTSETLSSDESEDEDVALQPPPEEMRKKSNIDEALSRAFRKRAWMRNKKVCNIIFLSWYVCFQDLNSQF